MMERERGARQGQACCQANDDRKSPHGSPPVLRAG
jgi:hypothetical protein